MVNFGPLLRGQPYSLDGRIGDFQKALEVVVVEDVMGVVGVLFLKWGLSSFQLHISIMVLFYTTFSLF